ncbi:MAG: Asp-tRNA(Asn)/Glu-tRNA(Gln) amidotransferase subunit GatC [Chloroflexi bacterium]|jgi:aspartyl-tRNA(Asn)/glutamyl-tRNA(Gln) amidotransferase subunit C|nr:Asp-tRNA(Asn)/Glu-tRNA(Gln) amidotransferase subunit GatC [Chloroflexota bacterium]
MALSREEVEHIAALAHLSLSEAELDLYQEQLSDILDHAERLQAIDTEEIPPTATVLRLRTVLREDEVRDPLAREEALRNAPEALVQCFLVPPLR